MNERLESALDAEDEPIRRSPGASSFRIATVVVLAIAAAICSYFATRPKPYAALGDTTVESRDAFRRGGRPVHDEVIDEALGRELAALSVAASHHIERGTPYDAELTRIAAAVRERSLVRALGPYPADSLHRLVAAYAKLVRGEGDAERLAAAIAHFNRTFAERGLGYRVTAFPIGMSVIALAVDSVERVSIHGSGASRRVVLAVERLDRLNLDIPYLGYIGPDDAIVIPIDAADRFVTTVLLPLLEPTPRLTLMDPRVDTRRHPWIVETHASAARVVRRAITEARCERGIDEVVRLLASRRDLFAQWAALLAQNGGTIRLPESYRFDFTSLHESARERLPRFHELERLDDALGDEEAARPFACVRDAVVDSLALSFLADDRRPVPPDELRAPPLIALIDPAQTMSADAFRGDPSVAAIRRKLAILHSAPILGFPLTSMLRCYTHGGSCDRASEVATAFIFMELARELRLASFVEPERAGASTVGAVYRDLAGVPSPAIRSAAGAVFRRVFGRDLRAR